MPFQNYILFVRILNEESSSVHGLMAPTSSLEEEGKTDLRCKL